MLLRSLEELGTWRVLWPLTTAVLEERDASAKVLARWVPLGLAVAHAVRQADAEELPSAGAAAESSDERREPGATGGRRGVVRKWATTNFDSGEAVAPTSASEASGDVQTSQRAAAGPPPASSTEAGSREDHGPEVPEVD